MKQASNSRSVAFKAAYVAVLAFHAISALSILFILLFFPYSIETDAQRANMRLMVLQCTLACVVIHAPFVMNKLFKLQIPTFLCVTFWFFLFCSVFLGEVASFYYIVPHWDDFLHLLSSCMTGLLGYMIFAMFFKGKNADIPRGGAVIFALCFSMAIGALWEIYEFSFDGLLKLNMQKYAFEDGVEKLGRLALIDTMKDIIVDTSGAVLSSLYGYFSLKHKKGFVYNYYASEAKAPLADDIPEHTVNCPSIESAEGKADI